MKPEESIYQAATKVNVLSPVIFDIVGAEVFHFIRKQHVYNRIGKVVPSYRGLRQWHGIRWNLCELGRSNDLFSSKSMRGQALKGEESQMDRWKSDSLIVLGARERLVHGKAVNSEGVRFSGGHKTLGGFTI